MQRYFIGASYPGDVIAGRPKVHSHVAAVGPTQARERLSERREASPVKA